MVLSMERSKSLCKPTVMCGRTEIGLCNFQAGGKLGLLRIRGFLRGQKRTWAHCKSGIASVMRYCRYCTCTSAAVSPALAWLQSVQTMPSSVGQSGDERSESPSWSLKMVGHSYVPSRFKCQNKRNIHKRS